MTHSDESVTHWAERWCAAREARGVGSVRDDRCRLRCHVLPLIGEESMTTVAEARLEDVRDALDLKVCRHELSWRTALHVWAVVRAMFREARASKVRALRVRGDDPSREIAPPDRGVTKSKQFLFPSELGAVLSCEAVPLAARRAFALATTLYLRASELAALAWDDIDLDHGMVHVHRSLGVVTEKATKGGVARRFRLEATLEPLLRAMHREGEGRGRVLGPLDRYGLARCLRAALRTAGVGRRELFANDRTRKWITFHDLRATGITWMAIRGDDPLKIRQRAGHRHLSTTERYIRVAEELRPGFGTVFPELPASLLGLTR